MQTRDRESVLYAAHGVTDRRRAHAEFSRSGREGPVASNTSNDRQMAEKIAIHSCTVSHTACDLNCLIEPCIRTLFADEAIVHLLRSGGNDVDRNYDKEDDLGKNNEKQLSDMSD